MKKLLTLILSLVIGLGCMASLVACGKTEDGNDADIAKRAIESIKVMYETKDKEVRNDYTVLGQVKVDNEAYAVTWTSDTENAKVGEMDATTKLITVAITPAAEIIDYKLTASVTVGEATESYSFSRKILAAVAEGDGKSVDSPFSVTQVFALADSIENNKYYDGATEGGVDADDAVRVYIKGYVVDPGKTTADGGKYAAGVQYAYIADDYSEEMNSYSDGAFKIGSITFDEEIFTAEKLLEKGETIIVSGLLEKYNNVVTLFAPKLDSTGEYVNINCEWRSGEGKAPETSGDIEKPNNSADEPFSVADINDIYADLASGSMDTEKVYVKGYITDIGKTYSNNLSSVKIADTNGGTVTFLIYDLKWDTSMYGEFVQDQSPFTVGEEITVYGFVKNYNGTLEMVRNGSDYPEVVKWVKSNGETVTPEVSETPDDDTTNYGTEQAPLSVTEALALAAEQCATSGNVTKQVVYMKGVVTDPGTFDGTKYTNMYFKDENDDGKTILAYTINLNSGVAEPVVGDTLVICGYIKNYNSTIEFASNSGVYVYILSNNEAGDRTPSVDPEVPSGATTASIKISEYATSNGWSNGGNVKTVNVDNNITATASSSGSNTGYTSASDWRIYQTDSGNLTFTAAAGYTIVSIKITYTSNNNGVLLNGSTQVKTNDVVEVNDSTITFTVGNTGSASNGQARITAIEVVYQAA